MSQIRLADLDIIESALKRICTSTTLPSGPLQLRKRLELVKSHHRRTNLKGLDLVPLKLGGVSPEGVTAVGDRSEGFDEESSRNVSSLIASQVPEMCQPGGPQDIRRFAFKAAQPAVFVEHLNANDVLPFRRGIAGTSVYYWCATSDSTNAFLVSPGSNETVSKELLLPHDISVLPKLLSLAPELKIYGAVLRRGDLLKVPVGWFVMLSNGAERFECLTWTSLSFDGLELATTKFMNENRRWGDANDRDTNELSSFQTLVLLTKTLGHRLLTASSKSELDRATRLLNIWHNIICSEWAPARFREAKSCVRDLKDGVCEDCGVAFFQSAFQCDSYKQCPSKKYSQNRRGELCFLVCAACYAYGTSCDCGNMTIAFRRSWSDVTAEYNQTASSLGSLQIIDSQFEPEPQLGDPTGQPLYVYAALQLQHLKQNKLDLIGRDVNIWDAVCQFPNCLMSHSSRYGHTMAAVLRSKSEAFTRDCCLTHLCMIMGVPPPCILLASYLHGVHGKNNVQDQSDARDKLIGTFSLWIRPGEPRDRIVSLGRALSRVITTDSSNRFSTLANLSHCEVVSEGGVVPRTVAFDGVSTKLSLVTSTEVHAKILRLSEEKAMALRVAMVAQKVSQNPIRGGLLIQNEIDLIRRQTTEEVKAVSSSMLTREAMYTKLMEQEREASSLLNYRGVDAARGLKSTTRWVWSQYSRALKQLEKKREYIEELYMDLEERSERKSDAAELLERYANASELGPDLRIASQTGEDVEGSSSVELPSPINQSLGDSEEDSNSNSVGGLSSSWSDVSDVLSNHGEED